MDEAMKYRIKNEKLAELVYAVFDEETVQQTIAERIDDGSYRIPFGSGEICHAKVKHEHEYLENSHSVVFLAIDKKEIEEIREYNPNGWNKYPEVKPPKNGNYLAQLTKENGEFSFWLFLWDKGHPWEGEFVFRELPEPYLEDDLEEGPIDEDIW